MLPSVFYRDLDKVPSLFGTSLLNDLIEGGHQAALRPAVDIGETEDAFLIKASLPGIKSDQIDIKLDKDKLILETKLEDSKEESSENWFRKEIHAGQYRRVFTLPDTIKRDAIDAKLDEGLLTIVLPKGEEHQPKTIKIS
ncbi:Hsp20/alpha crystallin family protein [Pseudobacteriovorax antillogorgiicola]|uniref:Heat shock protein Hsp20 n=1 Tax=Pseudobacteriovorax antillogorgiicola TaxID=1513793 RepID=A0A1Y6BJM9_9BACT|nr:Hsp20/alpha crystallin family protein [Pseudobacteriovorax antillogorgiicola]TCS56326.1 heat shock protein Hsp20 [Pseudobacteriovorax antillogorgiicola]SMF07019.1 heat shock protein Hsp20 [Pseudobacteriovorax antillogorgiicola]